MKSFIPKKQAFSMLLLFLSLFLLVPVGCKKKEVAPDNTGNPDDVALTLTQASAHQYGIVMVEADKDIKSFEGKVKVDTLETPAVLVDNKHIAFMIKPEVTAGTKKLDITVNGDKKHELSITILALPEITDPGKAIGDYKSDIDNYTVQTATAIDSVYSRLNMPKDDNIKTLENALKNAQDSINKYVAQFNSLPPDQKLLAAKIMSASQLDFQEDFTALKGFNGFMIAGGTMEKKQDNECNCDPYEKNVAQRMECFLSCMNIETRKMIAEHMLGTISSGALGWVIGTLINAEWGGKAGAVIAGGLYLWSTKDLLLNYGSILVSNFNTAFITDGYFDMRNKSSVSFDNDQYSTVKIKLSRRNMLTSDQSSSQTFLKDYVVSTLDFFNEMSSTLKWSPVYPVKRNGIKDVYDLSELKVTVEGNSDVQFAGISGTPADPSLKFTTMQTTDQNFTVRLKYDDGIFQTENTFDAVLKIRLGT